MNAPVVGQALTMVVRAEILRVDAPIAIMMSWEVGALCQILGVTQTKEADGVIAV